MNNAEITKAHQALRGHAMRDYSYAFDRRRYVSRKLSSLASRVRRVQLSKNGAPKISRTEDIKLPRPAKRSLT
jgi:hypothetical protein